MFGEHNSNILGVPGVNFVHFCQYLVRSARQLAAPLTKMLVHVPLELEGAKLPLYKVAV